MAINMATPATSTLIRWVALTCGITNHSYRYLSCHDRAACRVACEEDARGIDTERISHKRVPIQGPISLHR